MILTRVVALVVIPLLLSMPVVHAQAPQGMPVPQAVSDREPPEGPVAAVGESAGVLSGVVGDQMRQSTQVPAPAKPRAAIPGESVVLKPNVNKTYSIALYHVNRLITPFKDALIATSSTAGVSVDGNIINVISDREDPIGLFIYDRSAPTQAISLTLYPADIAPVSVTISVDGWSPQQQSSFGRELDPNAARAWENDAPYINTLKELFKGLALGRVPDGYGLRTLGPQDRGQIPYCAFQGLQVETVQALDGYSVSAYVARVTNVSYTAIDLVESACSGGNLLAVSAWPSNRVAPGEEVELYLAVKTAEAPSGHGERPSVIRTRR